MIESWLWSFWARCLVLLLARFKLLRLLGLKLLWLGVVLWWLCFQTLWSSSAVSLRSLQDLAWFGQWICLVCLVEACFRDICCCCCWWFLLFQLGFPLLLLSWLRRIFLRFTRFFYASRDQLIFHFRLGNHLVSFNFTWICRSMVCDHAD